MRKKNHRTLSACLLSASLLAGIPVLPLQAEEPVPEAPEPYGPTPSAGQMKYYHEEMSGFVHFGVNTFTNKEWGDGTENPDIFQPAGLDTDQWVETFKDAGFGRVILTAKHHDGFSLYPTSISDHSVKSSSWRNGEGDVVQDFVNSVKKYGMGLGFYLSPWDQNLPSYSKDVDPDYNDTYITQMEELFAYAARAGIKVDEFWMDGACGDISTRPKYDLLRWWNKLEELNPDIVYQQNYGANLRWIGNESGEGSDICWQTINRQYVWDLYDQHGQEDSSYLHTGEPYIEGKEDTATMWSIPETDVSIRSGWFYHANQTPKSPEKLAELYFSSVGLGSPLLLNIPPNPDGQFDQKDVDAVMGMRSILDNTFDDDLTEGAEASASSIRGDHEAYGAAMTIDDDYDTYWTMDDEATTGTVTVEFDQPQYMDVIEIQEYIPLGQRIASFKTEVLVNGQWQEYGSGHTIGYKRLVKGAPVMAEGVRVLITEAYATPLINNIGVYKADARIEEEGRTVPGTIECEDFDSKQGGPRAQVNDGVGNVGSLRNGDWMCFENVSFLQNPSQFSMTYGAISDGIEITLRADAPDGQVIARLLTEKTGDYTAWTTTTVDCEPGLDLRGTHNLYLCVNAGLNIDKFALTGENLFSFETDGLTVYEGDVAEITVVRSEEKLSEQASVTVETAPGSAVHGRHYEDTVAELVFAPGETRKTVQIPIIDNEETTGDLDFTVLLKNPSANAAVSAGARMTITIRDNETRDTAALVKALEKAASRSPEGLKPSTWNALQAAVAAAQNVLEDPASDQKDIDAACQALLAAVDGLRPVCYDEEDPAILSASEAVKLQAEDMVLNGTAEKYIRNGADGYEVINVGSDGKNVSGDLHAWVQVPAAGVYTVEMRYFTGAQNYMKWIVDENAETSGEKKLNWKGQASYHTDTFDVTFPEKGLHKIRFYDDERGACNPDSFTFVLKEKFPEEPETPVQADRTLLAQAVQEADRLQQAGALEGVNALVVQAFEEALSEARAVLESEDASQDEVNTAWKNLVHVIQMLNFTSDKTQLEELIAQAETIAAHLEQYEETGQEEFLAALAWAKEVQADPAALDAVSIQAACDRLQAAMEALQRKPVQLDTSVLEFLLAQTEAIVPGEYLSDGVSALQSAMEEAEAVLQAPQSQDQIDAAVTKLHDTYLNLRRRASEELLESLKGFQTFVLSLQPELFSSQELETLQVLQQDIRTLLEKPEAAEQDALDLQARADAFRALAESRLEQNVQPDPVKPGTPEESLNRPQPDSTDAVLRPDAADEKTEAARPSGQAKSVSTAALSGRTAASAGLLAAVLFLSGMDRKKKQNR